jgi:hypothetical protein
LVVKVDRVPYPNLFLYGYCRVEYIASDRKLAKMHCGWSHRRHEGHAHSEDAFIAGIILGVFTRNVATKSVTAVLND